MIYLYGLLEPGTQAQSDAFLDVPPQLGTLELVDAGAATLICGRSAEGTIRAKRRNLLAHAKILETAAEFGTVLPMRFGMTVRDTDEVARQLSSKARDVACEFDRLRGQEELGIRVAFPREAALEATIAVEPALARERDRLLAQGTPDRMKAAEFGRRIGERLERRRTDAQREILSRLGDAWREQVVRTPEEDVQILSADVLVPRNGQEKLAADVEHAAASSRFAPGSEPQVRIIGPMPPYSFVRLALGAPDEVAA